jgi:hypothetical protein
MNALIGSGFFAANPDDWCKAMADATVILGKLNK